jgi:hypothetical protein
MIQVNSGEIQDLMMSSALLDFDILTPSTEALAQLFVKKGI